MQAILADVRERGDAAVREYTQRFDGVALDDLRVDPAELAAALASIPPLLREALEAARTNIGAFHRQQLPRRQPSRARRRRGPELRRPVDRAGLYVPGGRARYPSTVLMTAIPARVAGVAELVLCVPPDADGHVAPVTLAAAALAGVDEVYRIGGAQAIAAMAYGTETIAAVDVIVGPGNVYVALAKREVAAGVVGVPSSFAGPSEVVVIADDTTPVEFAAIDVIVQAEHGPDGLAWLITWSEEPPTASPTRWPAWWRRRPGGPRSRRPSADGGYAAVVVDGPEQAMAVANAIAPEHLELMTADPEAAGAAGAPRRRRVLRGRAPRPSVGDYLAGPSHVLPTYGSARFASALRVDDFLKQLHVVTLDEATLARLAPHVAAIAEAEGLVPHAESVRLRGEL